MVERLGGSIVKGRFSFGEFDVLVICAIGYGNSSGLFDRLLRLIFSEACRVE